MKIELINQITYNKLLSIYTGFPSLTFQNKGYEYIPKFKLTDLDKEKILEVEQVLRQTIKGFSSFTNFRLFKDEIQLRFDYNYNYDGIGLPFIGVGYILLDELLNGFRELPVIL